MQKEEGAGAVLECAPGWRFLQEARLISSKASPVELEFVAKPVRGVRVRAFADPRAQVRAANWDPITVSVLMRAAAR